MTTSPIKDTEHEAWRLRTDTASYTIHRDTGWWAASRNELVGPQTYPAYGLRFRLAEAMAQAQFPAHVQRRFLAVAG